MPQLRHQERAATVGTTDCRTYGRLSYRTRHFAQVGARQVGRASSKKKRLRAARAAGAPRKSRSYAWPLTLVAVIATGTALIVVSVGNGDDERTPPRVGDHWHAAYGVYDCTSLIAPFGDSMGRSASGIHTHGDGLIHLEVSSSRYTGSNANIGAFAEGVGLDVDDDMLEGPGVSRRRGDRCGQDRGTVRLAVWDGAEDESPTLITDRIAEFAPQDGQLVTLAYAKANSPIPKPSASAIGGLQAQTPSRPPNPTEPAEPTVPASSPTTAAAPPDSTPDSSVP